MDQADVGPSDPCRGDGGRYVNVQVPRDVKVHGQGITVRRGLNDNQVGQQHSIVDGM